MAKGQLLKFERDLVFVDDEFGLDASMIENHPDYPLHVHDFSEIVIVLHGSAVKRVGESRFPISGGDVFVLHGRQPHGYECTNELSVINIIFDTIILRHSILDLDEMPGYQALFLIEPVLRGRGKFDRLLHLPAERLNLIKEHAEAINRELNPSEPIRRSRRFAERSQTREEIRQSLKTRKPGHRFIAYAHFITIVGVLARWYEGENRKLATSNLRIGEAISYMQRNFEEPLDIGDLARRSGMSIRNFYRVFLEVTGKTPQVYLRDVRLAAAVRLFETTEKNVTEAAFSCGFNDSNYFSRIFRECMGMTPREFRKRSRHLR